MAGMVGLQLCECITITYEFYIQHLGRSRHRQKGKLVRTLMPCFICWRRATARGAKVGKLCSLVGNLATHALEEIILTGAGGGKNHSIISETS